MKFHKFKIVLISLIGFSFVVGALDIYQASADPNSESKSLFDYRVVSQPNQLYMESGEIKIVKIAIKNTNTTDDWKSGVLRLGTIFTNEFTDRQSIWGKDNDNILPGWLSDKRIAPIYNKNIDSSTDAAFYFLVKAPDKSGDYRETFRPVLEDNRWLTGNPITIDIQVGQTPEVAVQEIMEKKVVIYRDTQMSDLVENGVVVASLPISSGGPGYVTPAGEYTIFNHIEDAYSSAYELWMPNWMGLSSNIYGFTGYGIHGLPYWTIVPNGPKYMDKDGQIINGRLYKNNKLYEGFSHLGTAVSHGCVRFGVRESDALFAWADNGTPVTVV